MLATATTLNARRTSGYATAGHPVRPPDSQHQRSDPWDVTSWVLGPRRSYRVNALFHRDDGAVVTACGRFDNPSAANALTAALHPFEVLGCAVAVDVRRAVLGEPAVRVLVQAGLRHAASTTGFTVVVAHAGTGMRDRFARAGGALLLRPCSRCGQDRAAPAGDTSW